MTDFDAAQLAAILDDEQLRTNAPAIAAVLAAMVPLVEAVEDSAEHIWEESVDLRRSEKTTVINAIDLVRGSLHAVLAELDFENLPDAGRATYQDALQASAEMGERLTEAASHMATRERSS